ncbi:MAG: hypothetical protein L6R40_002851 [Gallowayella cf. fulva]|nr:MAG: hypothetical protein L6R40_002851 [Xanthomendoza cf. fulva]
MAARKKKRKPLLLSHTRPLSSQKRGSLSSQVTRSLIRHHHTLQKNLHSALVKSDGATVEHIRTQLAASGGLQKYQEASIQGQSSERGGDSSKVLMEWVKDSLSESTHQGLVSHRKPRMLEVGALKVDNACSRSGMFDVTRIDLHSQHSDIRTQDFMEMSLPASDTIEKDGFDFVSLSLVVNYVGNAVERGEMLKRVSSFLRLGEHDEARTLSPSLFLVLPAPCVTNSRYMDEERLESIMIALGYAKTRRKVSKKLVYYLWRYKGTSLGKTQDASFKKQEIRSGANRNNFSIILQQ